MEGTTSAIVMHRIVASIEIKTGPMRGAPTIGGTGYYTTHIAAFSCDWLPKSSENL